MEVPIPADWLPEGVRYDGPLRSGPIRGQLLTAPRLVVGTVSLSALVGLLHGVWMAVLGRRLGQRGFAPTATFGFLRIVEFR